MAETRILTDRQYEVLHLVAHGWTLSEISVHLEVAESTVKDHLSAIFRKLEVHDRAAAVHQAHQLGILT